VKAGTQAPRQLSPKPERLLLRGDVYWVNLDPAVGTEIRKTRPAVIVRNDSANRHLARVVVVPITSSVSRVYPGEALVSLLDKPGKAMTDQIMAADKARLANRIDSLSRSDMQAIEDAILIHLGMPR
jgi:mRNA interferase MazF